MLRVCRSGVVRRRIRVWFQYLKLRSRLTTIGGRDSRYMHWLLAILSDVPEIVNLLTALRNCLTKTFE